MWSQPPTPHVCDREGWLGGWLERERTRASFVFKGSKMYCSSKAIECGRRFRSLALLCRCRCPCWHRCRTSAGAEQWSWTNMLRRMCGWVVCVCVYVLSTRVRTHKHTHVSHPHAHRCCCLSFALPLYHPLLSPNLPKTPNSPPLPPFACQSVSASRFVFYYSRPAYTKMATAPNSHTNSHMSIEYW